MKRNKFSLSNYKLLSCDMGELVPIGLTEVLPGDSVQQSTSALIRCSPLLAPVMHPVQVRIHHWYVPHRLVWEDWEEFITGGPDGMDASDWPRINSGAGFAVGSLADYLGLPTGIASLAVSAIPFRGYAMIWNEWYRDQDLQTELVIDETGGVDSTTSLVLQNVCWEKDYFTSARPWEQKGPAITIPLGTTAPVGLRAGADDPEVAFNSNTGAALLNITQFTTNGAGQLVSAPGAILTGLDPQQNLEADLSSASAITINLLREAFALQRFEEARARFGSRYTEYLRYLGVRSSDARLQRPEYLGGGKQTIQFSEVLQTAEGEAPVGEMRGHGLAAMRSNRYRRFFEEHGFVFSFLSVKPRTMYTQGIQRHWNRRVKTDYWQKELEAIGQQEIMRQEIYAASATPLGIFGYQDRYDEYRRTESTVAGEFRQTTLDHWHMARIFGSEPALNASFVSSVPTDRIFAAPDDDVLYVMANHSIQARRLVARTGKSYIY